MADETLVNLTVDEEKEMELQRLTKKVKELKSETEE